MRPRRLVVEAMGPFGSSAEVDFDEIGVDGLFLIHGSTGAGKTSLLDGICYALYGSVPGARAAARLERSHHASPESAPRALLEFDCGGGRYVVERSPAWEAPKKRGEGTTTQAAKAILRRIDSGRDEVLATKAAEVTAEVVGLIGLSAEQFQQVILLPQGRFERVLQANSREREQLFEKLFETLDFKEVCEWLDDEARRHREALGECRRHLAVIVDEVRRRTADIVVEVSFDGDEGTAVAAAVGTLDVAVREREAAESLAAKSEDDALEQLNVLERLAASFARRADLRAQREQLGARTDEIAASRQRLELARAAEALRPSLDEVTVMTAAVGDAETKAGAATADLKAAVGTLTVPLEGAEGLDGSSLPERAVLAAIVKSTTAMLDRLSRLEPVRRRLDEVEDVRRQAAADAERHGHRRQEILERIEALRERRAAVEANVGVAREAAARLEQLEAVALGAAGRAAAAAALAELEPECADAEWAHENARSAYNDAREAHLGALAARVEGMAAELAASLTDGEACPVCGSPEHPTPATSVTVAVTESQVERLAEQVRLSESNLKLCAEQLRSLQAEVVATRGKVGEGVEDPAVLTALARDANAAFDEAKRVAATLADHESSLSDLAESITDEEEAAERAGGDAASCTTAAEVAAGQVAELRSQLDAVLPRGVDHAVVKASAERIEELIGALEAHSLAVAEARSNLDAARQRLDRDLAASSFVDVEAVRAALVDATERDRLRQSIDDHDTALREAEAALADPALAELPDDPPDVAAARALYEERREHHRTKIAELATAREARDAVTERAKDHAECLATCDEAERRSRLHDRVANRCSGRTAPKVPLQRWVLGTYLEEVCAHANRRLAAMTAGRYRLLLTRTPPKGNQPAGLDLRVHDANTNREREVTTLSGGETFQASLALALGVADSVAAHTGGVRLDALFIDEGFGTLDPDSLELAMDELDRLREGGRLVGVISHVQGLRERIRVGAEVHKSDSGSTVTVGEVSPP